MSASVLEIHDLHVSLPPQADRPYAVEGLNIAIERDQVVCVVGESGSGKTLTGRAVMRLLPAPHVKAVGGRIDFGGEDLLQASEARMRQIRGDRIAMIFQEPMTALNPLMTIGEQIDELVRMHTRLPKQERRARARAILDDVGLPDPSGMLGAYPHELSGGQRQRAMIAMALILEPDIIIADEPTTALDVTTQAQILKLLKDLQAEHHTGLLYITHDFGVVADIADRVEVMHRGLQVESGPAEQVLNRPQDSYTRSLIGAVPSLVPPPRPLSNSATVALETHELRKTYRSGGGLFGIGGRTVDAVKDVSVQLQQGKTLGIVGESGSGKSTLARLVVRILDSDSGRIGIGGTEITSLRGGALRQMRRRVQMVFQDPFGSLNPRYRVGRLIAEGMIVHGKSSAEAYQRAAELLELVGLQATAADRFPHEFSGGQRQRIGLARALALDPDILVADEPVSALDVSVQAQVLELLDEIRERLKLSMLFITHDLRVAAQVCDHIAVMSKGEVVEYGETSQLFANPTHSYTRELLNAVPGRSWSPDAIAASS
ncbi:MAG: ABC transporter ATP-binding protein [Pseudomonadota bacterium]